MNQFILFLFTLFSCTVHAENGTLFSSWIKKEMVRYHVPGLSIAVIKNYKIVWKESYGIADKLSSKPVTPDVLFQAASLSKPVTAMGAFKAVQEGRLSLNENINHFLKSWKVPSNSYTKQRAITLKLLLSHSAGVNVSGFSGYAKGEKLPTLIEVLNGLPLANSEAIRVTTPVGKQFKYSGGGYTIIQAALMDVYHTSFTEVMNQLVLKPLEMTKSTFQQPLPASMMNNIALPYRPNGEKVQGGPHTYIAQAAAGLWTTPSDLARFVISLQKSLRGNTNQVLSKSAAEALAVHIQSHAPHVHMGMGMLVGVDKYGRESKNGKYFSHAGQNEGYRNLIVAGVDSGNGIVIMTNMSPPGNVEDDSWDFIYAIVKKIADEKIN